MAVSVEMQHTGDPNMQAEVRAVVEHVLVDRPGDWRVSITGSEALQPTCLSPDRRFTQ
jgi:tagatose-1,6-bisphosphate aldolase non-catalytic subunit AgaZ/GatZ